MSGELTQEILAARNATRQANRADKVKRMFGESATFGRAGKWGFFVECDGPSGRLKVIAYTMSAAIRGAQFHVNLKEPQR